MAGSTNNPIAVANMKPPIKDTAIGAQNGFGIKGIIPNTSVPDDSIIGLNLRAAELTTCLLYTSPSPRD